jgi:hypothetical protein
MNCGLNKIFGSILLTWIFVDAVEFIWIFRKICVNGEESLIDDFGWSQSDVSSWSWSWSSSSSIFFSSVSSIKACE